MSDPVGQEFDLDAEISAALNEPEPAPETPEASSEPETPPTDTPDPAAPPASPEGTDPSAPVAPDAPAVDLSKYLPLEGGQPFTFRVDGRQVAPEGATVNGDRIVFPVATWQRSMHTMLADRGAIRERESSLKNENRTLKSERESWNQEKSALLAEIDKLFSDPTELQRQAENWHVNGPRLRAEMKAQAYERQLRQYQEMTQQEQRQQHEAALEPKLFEHVAETIESLLNEQQIDWANDPDKSWGTWLRDIWEDHGKAGLFSTDPISGNYVLNEDKVLRLYQREAARYQASRQAVIAKTAVAEKKQELNAAALAPPKQKPPVPGKPAPRAPDGTFTTKKAKPQTPDEWEAEFKNLSFKD